MNAAAEDLDRRLREAAKKTTSSFLDFADLAAQAIREKTYEHFGYQSEEAYFDERVSVGYRTLRRWLQAHAGIEALPVEEQAEAKELLARLGVHKAAALAPVLKLAAKIPADLNAHPVDWREQVKFAGQATTAAVQARATDITGAKPRGMADAPGVGFLRFILSRMPPSEADFVERVFSKLMSAHGIKHPVAAFLVMVEVTNIDLAAQGQGVERDEA